MGTWVFHHPTLLRLLYVVVVNELNVWRRRGINVVWTRALLSLSSWASSWALFRLQTSSMGVILV
jgi:hypothetical protein